MSFNDSKGANHKKFRTMSSSSNVEDSFTKTKVGTQDVSFQNDMESVAAETPATICRNSSGKDYKDSALSLGSSGNVFLETSDNEDGVEPQPSTTKGPVPSTPPTFRLSKRRQAQLRRKRATSSLTASNLKKMSVVRQGFDDIDRLHQPIVSINSLDEGSIAAHLRYQSEEALSPAGASASHSSYPPSEMDTSVTSEHLTTEEVVNCACKRTEEDGLMIQCDICLCWQHGYCLGIEEEDQVQDYYVCETCRHPRLGRTDAQLSVDQDWLNKGALPEVTSILTSRESTREEPPKSGSNESIFRKLSDLMADLSGLSKVLHSLRVKLQVASQHSSKVFMWSSVWDAPSPTIAELKAEQLRELSFPKDQEQLSEPISSQVDAFESELPVTSNCEIDPPALPSGEDPAGNETTSVLISNGENCDDGASKPNTDKNANSFSSLEGSVGSDKTSNDHGSTENDLNKLNMRDGETLMTNGNKFSEGNSPKQEQIESNQSAEDADNTQVDQLDTDQNGTECPKEARNDEVTMKVNGCVSLDDSQDNLQSTEEGSAEATLSGPSAPSPVAPAPQGAATDTFCESNDTQIENDVEVDPSMIPSLSEVQRLLPGLMNSLQQEEGNQGHQQVVAPPAAAPPIIIEPKRIDKDECRMNLLHHIDAVQTEFGNRLDEIEKTLEQIEAGSSNDQSSGGIGGKEIAIKTRNVLALLLRDIESSRNLVSSE